MTSFYYRFYVKQKYIYFQTGSFTCLRMLYIRRIRLNRVRHSVHTKYLHYILIILFLNWPFNLQIHIMKEVVTMAGYIVNILFLHLNDSLEKHTKEIQCKKFILNKKNHFCTNSRFKSSDKTRRLKWTVFTSSVWVHVCARARCTRKNMRACARVYFYLHSSFIGEWRLLYFLLYFCALHI